MTALAWRIEVKWTGPEAKKRVLHPDKWEHYHTTHDELEAIRMGGKTGPGFEHRTIPLFPKDD